MNKEDITKAIIKVESSGGKPLKERLFPEGMDEEFKNAKKTQEKKAKNLFEVVTDEKSIIKKYSKK